MLPAAPVILAVLVIFTFLEPVTIDRAGDQIIYFTSLSTHGPPAWLVLPISSCWWPPCWPVRPRSSADASPTSGRSPHTAGTWSAR